MRTYLGKARVYREDGELVVDTDSIRRDGELSGVDDFGDDDYDDFEGDDDYDDFGDNDEDFGDDDEDDFGEDDEDFGEDDDDDDDDEEFGATRGQRRRRRRRGRRRGRRSSRRSRRRETSQKKKQKKVKWQNTVLGGSDSEDSAGAISVVITPSHPFVAEDIAFNGSSANATVNSIIFGDDLVWNNAEGIDVSALSSNSFIRGLVKGAKAHPGVPIIINGAIDADGDTLKVVLYGKKPCRR